METYIGWLKDFMQAGLAPVFQTKNDRGEVRRHKNDMETFNTFAARIWKLAGLDPKATPTLIMTEDAEMYTTSLRHAKNGLPLIPVYALIDNPSRIKTLMEDVLPEIIEIFGKTDGAINASFSADEADASVRAERSVGAKCWTDPYLEWESLYQAFSRIVYITATPAAIHLSEDRMGSKEHGLQEMTPSPLYWRYGDPSKEPLPNARVVSREIGDMGCMLRKMVSSPRVQCALALQSSVSEIEDIKKEAKTCAVKYAEEGVTCVAWSAGELIVYTADAGMAKVCESGKFFKDPRKLAKNEVSKIKRQLQEQQAAAEKPDEGKTRKKGKTCKKKKKKKRKHGAEEPDEEEPDEEELGEENRGGEELPRVYQYTPRAKIDNDYPPFITFLHDKIGEVGFADVVPKLVTFGKGVAGRARVIKGKNHEWPLDHLFLDLPRLNYESVAQAAGRLLGVDTRTLMGQGPTMWGSKRMQRWLTKSIEANDACLTLLRNWKIPLIELRELLKEVKSASEGTDVVAESGAHTDLPARCLTRNGVGLAFTSAHDEITRESKSRNINIVSPPLGDAMDEEEGDEEEEQDHEEQNAQVVDQSMGGPVSSSGQGSDTGMFIFSAREL